MAVDYPEFGVVIVAPPRYLRQPGVPVGRGRIRLRGNWPNPPAGTVTLAVAAYCGLTCNGFHMRYELIADVPASLHGRTELNEGDLQNPSLHYTDDLLAVEARLKVPVEKLIAELRRPENRIPPGSEFGVVIPGGEWLPFSVPLKALMLRGAAARGPLVARLDDPEVRNEAALALGAIGDEATVPELIARYPRGPGLDTLTRVCFSFALCRLTGEPIDRTRAGTNWDDGNAGKWEAWWAANRTTFRVPAVKPNASWVPSYPELDAQDVARVRSAFVEGDQGFGWE